MAADCACCISFDVRFSLDRFQKPASPGGGRQGTSCCLSNKAVGDEIGGPAFRPGPPHSGVPHDVPAIPFSSTIFTKVARTITPVGPARKSLFKNPSIANEFRPSDRCSLRRKMQCAVAVIPDPPAQKCRGFPRIALIAPGPVGVEFIVHSQQFVNPARCHRACLGRAARRQRLLPEHVFAGLGRHSGRHVELRREHLPAAGRRLAPVQE